MKENKITQLQNALKEPKGRLVRDILAEHYLECDKQFATLSSISPIKKVVDGAMIEINPEDVEVGMNIVIKGSWNDLMKQSMVVESICHENDIFVFEGKDMVVSDITFSHELKALRQEKNYKTPTEVALDMQSQAIAERCISKKKDLIHLYPETLSAENIFGENISTVKAGQLVKLNSRAIKMEDISRNVGRGWQMDARGHDYYDGLDGKIYKSVFVQDAVKLEPSGDWIIETPSAIYTTLNLCDKWEKMLLEEELIAKRDLIDSVSREHNHWFRPNTVQLIKMCYPRHPDEASIWAKDSEILGRVSSNIHNMSMDEFSWYKVESIVEQSIRDVEKERKQEVILSLADRCMQSEKNVFMFTGYVSDIDAKVGSKISPTGHFKNLTKEETEYKNVEFDEMKVTHQNISDAGLFIETNKMIFINIPEVANLYSEAIAEIHKNIERENSHEEINEGSEITRE